MTTRRRASTRHQSSKQQHTSYPSPPRVSSTRRKRAAVEESVPPQHHPPATKKRKEDERENNTTSATTTTTQQLTATTNTTSTTQMPLLLAPYPPDMSMAAPPPPGSPTSKPTTDDETARSLLVMHSSPARGTSTRSSSSSSSSSSHDNSPMRPRRASFATEVAHMLVSPTKPGQNSTEGLDDASWQEASLHAASILSGMSPLSTPIKKDAKKTRRTPGGYRNKPGAYSPFSNFAANQLSPLMTMNGAPEVQFPVNIQNWDYSVGATPSPMRAAIANGALSLMGNLMSPAPGSVGQMRGAKMGRHQQRGPGFAQKLEFALDPEQVQEPLPNSRNRRSSKKRNYSSSSSSSSHHNIQKRPMKFMLQPNGGLSQGLHPMGDFFGGSPSGSQPPHDMFDPLSEGSSPRTWARSPGSDGGDRRHIIHHGSRSSSSSAKRSLSTRKPKGKTPGTDNGKGRSKRRSGGDRSKHGSRVSQAAKMRAALAMAEFEMISGGSSAQAPPTQPCNCKKSKCLKLYCECFASGNYCNNCNCNACSNNKHSEPARRQAVQATLERNPNAFKPKVQPDDAEARHSKGCHCKKSQCLKKYCECFQADIVCGTICKCQNCENYTGSVLLKEIRISKPRSRTSPPVRRVATPGSVVGGPSILMAAAQEKVKQDAILEDILFKQQQQQQKLASDSMSQELVVPATPSSPASEMTSEWTPFSNSKPKEEGTKPFGKSCPCLKQNVVFQIFSYLDNEDLTEASLVSKENHRLAMHDAVWHFLPANNTAP